MPDHTLVTFTYTNYKGETGLRRVRPIRLWFGSTAWHPEAQWLLEAFDLDKEETRDFALSDISSWKKLVDGGKAEPRRVMMGDVAEILSHRPVCSQCRGQHFSQGDCLGVPLGISLVKIPGGTNMWMPCPRCKGSGLESEPEVPDKRPGESADASLASADVLGGTHL